MQNTNQSHEDIDLLEFLFILWSNKLLIIVCAILASVIGGVFVFINNTDNSNKTDIYKSEIIYNVDLMPPRYLKSLSLVNNEVNRRMIISNFQNLFFSKEIFMSWKNKNTKFQLDYDDIDVSMDFRGVVVLKEEDNRLVMFKSAKRDDYEYISVKVTELNLLNEIYSFAQYVADKLTEQHILLSNNEKLLIAKKNQMIEEGFRDFYNQNVDSLSYDNAQIILQLGNYFSEQIGITNDIKAIDKYIHTVNNGRKAINIQYPSIPKKILQPDSNIPILSIAVFAFLGAMSGGLYVILINSIRRRNERLAKT